MIKNMIITISKDRLEKADEKIILIAMAGTLEAIKNGGITIEEAESFLFSPYTEKKLRAKKCKKEIIELVQKGCELEDIVSLIPEELNNVIDELKQEIYLLLKKYETFDGTHWLEG